MIHIDSPEIYWRYPAWGGEHHPPAPRGTQLALLTIGNKQVGGQWSDDGSCKAWCPLIKRDKTIERELGYMTEVVE